MPHILRFEHSLDYDAGKEGITVPVTLRMGLIDYEGKLYLGRADDET
jgi:hypothetical protein